MYVCMYVKTYNTFIFSVQVQKAVTSKKMEFPNHYVIIVAQLVQNCFAKGKLLKKEPHRLLSFMGECGNNKAKSLYYLFIIYIQIFYSFIFYVSVCVT